MRSAMVWAILIGFIFIPSAWADDHVATIKKVTGTVSVERDGTRQDGKEGRLLTTGDIIRTGPDGSAGIMFLDGSSIGIGPSSELRIDDFVFKPLEEEYAFDVYMKKGSAVYSSGKLGRLAPDAVEFRTPKAAVGIRGTRFLVMVK